MTATNRNGNRVFPYSGLALLTHRATVGTPSLGPSIMTFSVRLMTMLTPRKAVRQLCGVRTSYIGSSVEINVQLTSVKATAALPKASVGF